MFSFVSLLTRLFITIAQALYFNLDLVCTPLLYSMDTNVVGDLVRSFFQPVQVFREKDIY